LRGVGAPCRMRRIFLLSRFESARVTRLGAILAGGEARRFGSDKALATWRGRPLIAHAAAILARHCDAVIVCGRRHAPGGLRCVADRPAPGLGPLGGLCAALHEAAAAGQGSVLTLGCDMPLIDETLFGRLAAFDDGCYLAAAPIVGCWPARLAAPLADHLDCGGDRSVRGWAGAAGVSAIEAGGAIVNLNTPADLVALDRAAQPSGPHAR